MAITETDRAILEQISSIYYQQAKIIEGIQRQVSEKDSETLRQALESHSKTLISLNIAYKETKRAINPEIIVN